MPKRSAVTEITLHYRPEHIRTRTLPHGTLVPPLPPPRAIVIHPQLIQYVGATDLGRR
jgi:hypothetical protein